MLEMQIVLHGTVQSLSYHYAIINYIDSQHFVVKGYIQNLPNGTTKIIVQGDIEALKDIRRFIINGPHKAFIRDAEEVISEINEFSYPDFSIKY